MQNAEKDRLDAELAAAEAEVTRLRAENAKLSETYREAPNTKAREALRRGADALASARDRVEAAKASLEVFKRTGSLHGLVADEGKVFGTIAVKVAPGATRDARLKLIEDAVLEAISKAADDLGVVLAATPSKFTRERPGRDAEGRTVLEVAGRVEGDRLVPAVSRAAKKLRG